MAYDIESNYPLFETKEFCCVFDRHNIFNEPDDVKLVLSSGKIGQLI